MNKPLIPCILLAALALVGCAITPQNLQGEYVATDPRQNPEPGTPVRWGGDIVRVETKADRTCFQVLGRALGSDARPRRIDATIGRFLACHEGFFDPALYRRGREITVIGHVDGYETRPVGAFDYEMPRVRAEAVHLWRKPVEPQVQAGFGWGWWPYDPFYRPRVYYRVIRRPRPH